MLEVVPATDVESIEVNSDLVLLLLDSSPAMFIRQLSRVKSKPAWVASNFKAKQFSYSPKALFQTLTNEPLFLFALGATESSLSLPSSIFVACGAVLLIPDSSLSRLISKSLITHQLRTVLIEFLISLPFNSHFASSFRSLAFNFIFFSSFGRRSMNFCHSWRRAMGERAEKRRWMFTRERKALSIVERRFVVRKTEFLWLVF